MITDCGTLPSGKKLFGIRFNGPWVGTRYMAAMFVAVVSTDEHPVRDWAVYAGGGYGHLDDQDLAAAVARSGQKLSREHALAFFPGFEERHGVEYRA